MQERVFWGKLLMALAFATYAQNKYTMEKDRAAMWDRKSNLKEMPGHHFVNRGGVLIEKKFMGFQKYYKNTDDLMGWYYRAYPSILGTNPD